MADEQPGQSKSAKRRAAAKRAKEAAEVEAPKPEAPKEPPKPKAEAKAAAKAEAKAPAEPKAKAKAKAKAAPKAKARAKAKATPKAKARAKAQAKASAAKRPLPTRTAAPTGRARGEKPAAAEKTVSQRAVPGMNLAKFNEQRDAFQSWPNEKLKALLKANDQSRSGNKAVLVAKCADGAAFGKLPRCPKCFGGKIKFRLPGADGALRSLFRLYGGAYGEDKESDKKEDSLGKRKRYYCTGYFDDDEKQECDWQSDTVQREPWAGT